MNWKQKCGAKKTLIKKKKTAQKQDSDKCSVAKTNAV